MNSRMCRAVSSPERLIILDFTIRRFLNAVCFTLGDFPASEL
jgi:hypothetical protein